MNASVNLTIYRITSAVLIAPLVLMLLMFRHNIIFSISATTMVTLVLILIAFQVQRLRLLTIAKLDELLELLRDSKRELSPSASNQIERELAEMRARLLRYSSFKQRPLNKTNVVVAGS